MKQTPITEKQLADWSADFNGCPQRQIAALALSKSELKDVSYVVKGSFAMDQKFSVDIPTLPVTNQQASGRCWLFAAATCCARRSPPT